MRSAAAGPGYNERLFSGGVRRYLHLARFKWLARAVAKHSTSYKTVLELGCFDGRAIDFLPESPVLYSGFDANWEGGLDLARERWRSQPDYTFNLARTPEEMSLDEPDRFDIAIVMETLEHLPPGLVDGYLEKISSHLDGHLFVTIPNEKGIVFLAKFLAKKFIMKQSERYSLSEIMNATLGRMSEVDRREHKGFDYESMIGQVGKHFHVLEVTGIPYSRLPCPLSFGIGVVAQSRPAVVSQPSTTRSD